MCSPVFTRCYRHRVQNYSLCRWCNATFIFAGVRVTVQAERPVRCPLHLRIPAWAEGATLQIGDDAPRPVAPGTFHREEREWRDAVAVTLHLPMQIHGTRRLNNSVALYRGPLLLALKIGEAWRQIGGELPHADWDVLPTTPWNYALAIDPDDAAQSVQVHVQPVGMQPFSPDGAPVVATVLGGRVAEWSVEHNAAAPVPASPAHSSAPLEELTLVPYGATNLRIAEFPVLAR